MIATRRVPVYRNTVQFQSLLGADRESDMMQSLVNDAQQSGRLPGWPVANESTHVMSGDSAAILLSSSYAFGAHKFDTKAALRYMVKGGSVPEHDVSFDTIYGESANEGSGACGSAVTLGRAHWI
jgi:putative alpha-1,2-mannosidase